MNFLSRLFARDTFEEVNNARIHAIVNPTILRALQPLGFEEAGDLKWVRDRHAPIRHLFAFTKWKGGKMPPRWGVSVDFVPHVSGQQVRWHRSNTAAIADLCVDPRDKVFDMTYTRGERAIRLDLGRVITAAAPQANAFWALCDTTDGLWDAITWVKNHLSTGDGLRFGNYTQHNLTVAFLLARGGRRDEAVAVMEQHLKAMNDLIPAPARTKLLKMVSEN